MEAEARLVPLYEVLGGSGSGWIEIWLQEDSESPEEINLEEGAWCRGHTIYANGSTAAPDQVARDYGRRYGCRYWEGRPTDGQREAAPWATEEGEDVVGRVR